MCTLLRLICTTQLDQILMLQAAVDQHSVSTEAVHLQNKERAYRQKLLAYQEAQQRQVQLVHNLQTKVATGGSHTSDISMSKTLQCILHLFHARLFSTRRGVGNLKSRF